MQDDDDEKDKARSNMIFNLYETELYAQILLILYINVVSMQSKYTSRKLLRELKLKINLRMFPTQHGSDSEETGCFLAFVFHPKKNLQHEKNCTS